MSKHSQHPKHGSELKHSSEHGTTMSYVIGFILSLVATFIPYYLVVNQVVTGTMLLVVILGFAFLQAAIQIIFFLHLGRGPKPLYNIGFFVGTFAAIMVVVGGSIYIMQHLHNNMAPPVAEKVMKLAEDEGIYQIAGQKTGACRGVYTNHKVVINNGVANPSYIDARLCETITFIKEDDVEREITFAAHPEHGSYAGETELRLRKGRGAMIVLGQLGTYQFHDHLNPGTAGYFTVKPE